MLNWQELEGYHKGSIYSRFTDTFFKLENKSFVLCTIPRLFTPHCANELVAADNLYQEFKDYGIPVIFASNDTPEVAEQYFGKKPVGFPFIRINRQVEYDLGTTDRFGDPHRATYYIKNGNVLDVEVTKIDEERDFWHIFHKARKVLV